MIVKLTHQALNKAIGKDLSLEDIRSALEDMGMEEAGLDRC